MAQPNYRVKQKSASGKFKFVSFSERISLVNVDVFHPVGGRKDKLENLLGECFLQDGLHRWRDLDRSAAFAEWFPLIAKWTQSYPLVVLHQNDILSEIIKALRDDAVSIVKANKRKKIIHEADEDAEQETEEIECTQEDFRRESGKKLCSIALFDLLPRLARDTRADGCVSKRIEEVLAVLVLQVQRNASHPERLEAVVKCIAFLFKFLERRLVEIASTVVSLHREVLGHEKDYVRHFVAEACAFLLRKQKCASDVGEVFSTLFDLLEKKEQSESSDNGEELQNGIAHIIYQTSIGAKTHLHSRAKIVMEELLRVSATRVEPRVGECIAEAMELIAEHTRADTIVPIWELLLGHVHSISERISAATLSQFDRVVFSLLKLLSSFRGGARIGKVATECCEKCSQVLVACKSVCKEKPEDQAHDDMSLVAEYAVALLQSCSAAEGFLLEWMKTLPYLVSAKTYFDIHLTLCGGRYRDTYGGNGLWQVLVSRTLEWFVGKAEKEERTAQKKGKKKRSRVIGPAAAKVGLSTLQNLALDGICRVMSSDEWTRSVASRDSSESCGTKLMQLLLETAMTEADKAINSATTKQTLFLLIQATRLLIQEGCVFGGKRVQCATNWRSVMEKVKRSILPSCAEGQAHSRILLAEIWHLELSLKSLLSSEVQATPSFTYRQALQTAIQLVSDYSTSPSLLDVASKILTAASANERDRAEADVSLHRKCVADLSPNLSHPSLALRSSTVSFLFNLLQPCFSHNEKAFLSKAVGSEANFLRMCVRLVTLPLSISSCSEFAGILGKIQVTFDLIDSSDSGSIAGVCLNVMFPHVLCGLFWRRFRPLWLHAWKCVEVYSKSKFHPLWKCAWSLFTRSWIEYKRFGRRLDTTEDKEDTNTGIRFHQLVRNEDVRWGADTYSTNLLDFGSQLLLALSPLASQVETRSRAFVPFFLDIVHHDYHPLYEAAPLRSDESRVLRSPIVKRLKEILAIFESFRNPKSLFKSEAAYSALESLLSRTDPDVQLSAFRALMTWRPKAILPYKTSIEKLIDPKTTREILPELSLEEERGTFAVQHRVEVLKLLIPVVYGKLLAKPHRRHTVKSQRAVLLSFLSGAESKELIPFFDLVLQRFEHDGLVEDQQQEDEADKHNFFVRYSARACQGFLAMCDACIKYLGAHNISVLPRYMTVLCQMGLSEPPLAVVGGGGYEREGDDEEEKEDERDEDEAEEGVFTPKGTKLRRRFLALRSLALGRISDIVRTFPNVPLDPWLNSDFLASLRAKIERLPQEVDQQASTLLKLLVAWSARTDLVSCLCERTNYFVSAAVAVLISRSNDLAEAAIEFFNNILTVAETSTVDGKRALDTIRTQASLLLDQLHDVLLRLPGTSAKARRKAVSAPTARQQMIFLEKLAPHTVEEDQAAAIVQLLLPFAVAAQHRRPESFVRPMRTIAAMAGLVREADSMVRPIASMLSDMEGQQRRSAICVLLQSLSASKESHLHQHNCRVADVVAEANAFDATALDEDSFDYERRLRALRQMTEMVTRKAADGSLVLSRLQLLPILYTCLHDIRLEDLALRAAASEVIAVFAQSVSSASTQEKTAAPSSSAITSLVHGIVVPGVRRGLRIPSAPVREESLKLLGVIATAFPQEYSDLALCANRNDHDNDLFECLVHIQLHRRGRALKRLRGLIRASTFKPHTLDVVFIPFLLQEYTEIVSSMSSRSGSSMRNHTSTGRQQQAALTTRQETALLEEMSLCLASAGGKLSWPHYVRFVRHVLQGMERVRGQGQKHYIALICRIMDQIGVVIKRFAQLHAANCSTHGITVEDESEHEDGDEEDGDDVSHRDGEEGKGKGKMARGQPISRKQPLSHTPAPAVERVRKAVEREMIPNLFSVLQSKDQIRLSVALALVRLIKLVEGGELEAVFQQHTEEETDKQTEKSERTQRITEEEDEDKDWHEERHIRTSKLFSVIVESLKSRDQDTRDSARHALKQVVAALGPRFVPHALKELQFHLSSGYMRLVLPYTLHTLLSALLAQQREVNDGDADDERSEEENSADKMSDREDESHTEALESPMKTIPRVVLSTDSALLPLVEILVNDIIGEGSAKRDVQQIARKMREARGCKSYDALEMLSQLAIFPKQTHLIVSAVREVLIASPDASTASKMQAVLKRVMVGVIANPSVTVPSILVFAHNLLTTYGGNLMRFRAQQQKNSNNSNNSNRSGVEEEEEEEEDHDSLLSAPIHQRLQLKPRTAEEHFRVALEPRKARALAVSSQSALEGGMGIQNHYLAEFSLSLLNSFFKKNRIDVKNALHLSMVDPLLEVLLPCLSSPHTTLIVAALQCYTSLSRMPLPSVPKYAVIVFRRCFKLLRSPPCAPGTELRRVVLKCITALIRQCPTLQLQQTELKRLLQTVERDLDHSERQGAAFALLKAILQRKLVVAELYDLMRQICRLCVTSHHDTVRAQCGALMLLFLLYYPLGNKRVQQQLDFVLKNMLSYPHPSGRTALLSVMQRLVQKLPQALLDNQCLYFLLPLVQCATGDVEAQCRRCAGEVVVTLLSRVSPQPFQRAVAVVSKWLHTTAGNQNADEINKKEDRRMKSAAIVSCGAQALVLLVQALVAQGDCSMENVRTKTPIIFDDLLFCLRYGREENTFSLDDEAEEAVWKICYFGLKAAEELLLAVMEEENNHYADSDESLQRRDSLDKQVIITAPECHALYDEALSMLTHHHLWVRMAASRLLGVHLTAIRNVMVQLDPVAAVGQQGKTVDALTKSVLGPWLCAPYCSSEEEEGGDNEQEDEDEDDEDVHNRQSSNQKPLSTDRNLEAVVHQLCRQLSGGRALSAASGDQCIRNLLVLSQTSVFVATAQHTAETVAREMTSKVKRKNTSKKRKRTAKEEGYAIVTENKGGEPIPIPNLLHWLFRRMSFLARKGLHSASAIAGTSAAERETCLQSAVFKWFAAMVGGVLPQAWAIALLPSMIHPLYRVVESPQSSSGNGVDESEARVTALAKEVVGMIRTSVGNSAFATAWADVRAHVMEVRHERREKRKRLIVLDPKAAAERKIKRHKTKQQAKKRKMEKIKERRGGAKAPRLIPKQ